MKNSIYEKMALTISFIVMALPSFASSENGGTKILAAAVVGFIFYGGRAIYRSFKDKK